MSATALAASSVAISSAASIQAEQAKRISCEALLNSFDAQYATVVEMRQYSECVDVVYPKETIITPEMAIFFKVLVFILLISAPVAAFFTNGDWEDRLGMAILAPLSIFVGCILLAVAYSGVVFILS